MKIEVNEKGEIVLSQVYNAIGIKTEAGTFGIAERDGGIEVLLNGEVIFSRTVYEPRRRPIYAPC